MYKKFVPDFIWMRLRKVYHYLFCTYRYRVDVTGAQGIKEKLPLLLKSVRRALISRKKILFYPDGPKDFHALYKILKYLGYRVGFDARKRCDLAIKWWLAFDGNPYAPEKPFPAVRHTGKGRNGARLLNIRCNDISKTRVNSTFEEVFGYALAVDPRKHTGKCVMKLNWNALHIGGVIECPVKSIDPDYVYQKLIANEVEDGLVEDLRVPIFGNKTPFVYLKYRSVKHRFVDRKHTNVKATIAEVADVLTADELNKVHRFCAKIGLDYGEVDVLRDSGDGRIYIVDANNTPSGPTSSISDAEGKIAVMRLSQAFEEAFGV